MSVKAIKDLVVTIKGAGEMASGVAWRLYKANIRRIYMMEIPYPLAVRREVSFCEAVHDGSQAVEGVEAIRAGSVQEIHDAWDEGKIAAVVDPEWKTSEKLGPDVMVDAILAKRNLGTVLNEAPLVIGLGPGFVAGKDVHLVIETNRGHHLGRIITSGSAESNTGIPGSIGGFAAERVLRAPTSGIFRATRTIGDIVTRGEVVGDVEGVEICAHIDGVIRGVIRSGNRVVQGLKLGDIDPRADSSYCHTISDKARAIGGSVLEAILRVFNR